MGRTKARTGPRGDIKAFRRQQLIDATLRTIARYGFARTTMAHVAKAAGLSHGIVNFYFKTKEALLYETLVHLAEEYEAVLQRALDRAGPEPVLALDAMIETDLGSEVCTSTKATVWLAFWAESRGRPKYRQLCRKLAEDYFGQVRDLCTRLAAGHGYGETDIENISRSFNSLINGLWVDMAIDPQSFDRERARHACRAYLAGFFPAEFGPLLAAGNMNRRRAG
jgi:TetR/AcrR family transcriptional repressor of bet genes